MRRDHNQNDILGEKVFVLFCLFLFFSADKSRVNETAVTRSVCQETE